MTMSVSKPPLVYILILNYCAYRDTVESVESVRRIDYPNLRVVVLDNDSPDGSGEALRSVIPQKEFIQLKSNCGYAGGNNYGITYALRQKADYIFVVNPDVRIPPLAVSDYVEVMEQQHDVAALCPVQLQADGQSIDQRFERHALKKCAVSSLSDLKNNLNKIWDTEQLFGAALFISRPLLEKVGGFDPLYFAYGEEQDLCRRIRYHGFRTIITAKSPVIHLRTKEKQGISDRCLYLRLKGMYLYTLKNPYRNIRLSMRDVVKEFLKDYSNIGNHEFDWRWHHFMRVGIWLCSNIFNIRNHRRQERRGGRLYF